MERKLASIRKIKEILPIPDADMIVKAVIDGWQCVCKKGEFAPGDSCVYFEIDSFLPLRPELEFLRKSSYRKMGDQEGLRLKTIKLRKTLSQGLALPVQTFPELAGLSLKEGDDVTELLGVIKFEPPIPAELAGIAKGLIPSFIRKTDQERIQNIWEDIKDCTDTFEVTLKLDGASCTYYMNDNNFGVCSRNLELVESESNTLWKIARKIDIEGTLRSTKRNLAFQGEMIGEGIQKNPEKIKGQEFYLFDIWDIDAQKYLHPAERTALLETFSGKIKHVPFLGVFSFKEYPSLESLLQLAEGPSLNPKTEREGIVFRSNQAGLRFKVISNKYLLHEE